MLTNWPPSLHRSSTDLWSCVKFPAASNAPPSFPSPKSLKSLDLMTTDLSHSRLWSWSHLRDWSWPTWRTSLDPCWILFSLLRGLSVPLCPASKNFTPPEWGKGLRKSLWTPHTQLTLSFYCCPLAGATDHWAQKQPDTRIVFSPRPYPTWTTHNTVLYICK